MLGAGGIEAAYPARQVAGLGILCGRLDEVDLLRLAHAVEVAFVELVGECLEVAQDKFPGFVLCRERGVVRVVVPVEERLFSTMQGAEELLFHPVEHVETHEHVAVVGHLVYIELLHHLPLQHALIGQSLLTQSLLELGVDGQHTLPQRDKPLLEQRASLGREVAEKLADGLLLLRAEKAVVLAQGMELLQVAEEAAGINQVLVEVVEVADEQFAPEVEVVEALVAACL